MTLEESRILAAAAINLVGDNISSEQLKICQIKSDTKRFEFIDKNQITKLLQSAKEKYPVGEKQSS
jgi:20S proteasome alpha/beta subunit